MDFFSSKKKEINEAIESDAIFLAERVCLEQKILLPWQRDVKALELYVNCVSIIFAVSIATASFIWVCPKINFFDIIL